LESICAEGTEGVLNNLVIATFILAVAQPSSGPPLKPITDPDAYAIYAALISEMWQSDKLLFIAQETEGTPRCQPSRLVPGGWQVVEADFKRQNGSVWKVQAILPKTVHYFIVPRADIEADDARLALRYPGRWQQRPGSVSFAAVSAVGFNAERTRAMVNVRLRGSGGLFLMDYREDRWVISPTIWGCRWAA
jgi:hypothetical protein